jgi:hypothetical protein
MEVKIMENREFISAADLPITEAKEVSVLCLENGELKQKPANGLGGCPMLVINTFYTDYNGERDPESTVSPVPAGTFELVKNSILTGMPILIFDRQEYKWVSTESGDEDNGINWRIAGVQYYEPTEQLPEAILIEGNVEAYLLPDDRILTWGQFEQEMGGGE